jgi:hypothetical protein
MDKLHHKNISPDAPTIAIFGSYRHGRMNPVRMAIAEFQANGIRVTTPPDADPLDPHDSFVRFPGDDPNMPDHEIEAKILEIAKQSDATWVCCPNGYVGRATSYEIGYMKQSEAALYFSELPMKEEPWIRRAGIGRVATLSAMVKMLHGGTVTPISSRYD